MYFGRCVVYEYNLLAIKFVKPWVGTSQRNGLPFCIHFTPSVCVNVPFPKLLHVVTIELILRTFQMLFIIELSLDLLISAVYKLNWRTEELNTYTSQFIATSVFGLPGSPSIFNRNGNLIIATDPHRLSKLLPRFDCYLLPGCAINMIIEYSQKIYLYKFLFFFSVNASLCR